MDRAENAGMSTTGTTIRRPLILDASSERPNSSAAAMLAYSAACTPAVTTNVGPSPAPLMSHIGSRYGVFCTANSLAPYRFSPRPADSVPTVSTFSGIGVSLPCPINGQAAGDRPAHGLPAPSG